VESGTDDAGADTVKPQPAPEPVQVVDFDGNSLAHSSQLVSSSEIAARLTIALVRAGRTLLVGYAAWMLVNYSLSRHALLVRPDSVPMDVRCLLQVWYWRLRARSS
jgi:hypothetical protein